MSRYFLERAAYHLSLRSPLSERHARDPDGALSELLELSHSDVIASLRAIDLRLELSGDEERILRDGDVARMYVAGVHPNIVRNFAGTYGIDYVARYREAGLRDD